MSRICSNINHYPRIYVHRNAINHLNGHRGCGIEFEYWLSKVWRRTKGLTQLTQLGRLWIVHPYLPQITHHFHMFFFSAQIKFYHVKYIPMIVSIKFLTLPAWKYVQYDTNKLINFYSTFSNLFNNHPGCSRCIIGLLLAYYYHMKRFLRVVTAQTVDPFILILLGSCIIYALNLVILSMLDYNISIQLVFYQLFSILCTVLQALGCIKLILRVNRQCV